MIVDFDEGQVQSADIVKSVSDAGYEAIDAEGVTLLDVPGLAFTRLPLLVAKRKKQRYLTHNIYLPKFLQHM